MEIQISNIPFVVDFLENVQAKILL